MNGPASQPGGMLPQGRGGGGQHVGGQHVAGQHGGGQHGDGGYDFSYYGNQAGSLFSRPLSSQLGGMLPQSRGGGQYAGVGDRYSYYGGENERRSGPSQSHREEMPMGHRGGGLYGASMQGGRFGGFSQTPSFQDAVRVSKILHTHAENSYTCGRRIFTRFVTEMPNALVFSAFSCSKISTSAR